MVGISGVHQKAYRVFWYTYYCPIKTRRCGWQLTRWAAARSAGWSLPGQTSKNAPSDSAAAICRSLYPGVGVEGTTLKALFGWSQLATASHYVETSSERAQRALLAKHSR